MSRTRQFTTNAIANYLRFAVNVVAMFLMTPFIIRHIGRDAFGIWSLVFSILGIFALLDCGLSTTIVKAVADCHADGDTERRNKLLSTISVLYAVLSIISTLAILVVSLCVGHLVPAGADRHVTVAILWILALRVVILALPLGVYRDVLFGEQRIATVNVVQIASTVVYSLWTWYALVRHGGLMAMAWINLAAMVCEYSAYVILAYRLVPRLRVSWLIASAESIRRELGFSVAQLVVNTASLVRLRTDPVIVKAFLSLESVSVYTIALRIAESVLLLSKQITNIFAPMVARMHRQGDASGIRKILLSGAKLAFAASLAISLPICLLAKPLIQCWVGPEFAPAGPVLVVLLCAMSLVILQMAACSVLTMSGHHKLTARADVCGIAINLGVSVALAHRLGIVGIAVGTLVSTILVDVLFVVGSACRIYGISYYNYVRLVVLPMVLPGIASALAVFGAESLMGVGKMHFVAVCAACGVLGFVAAFALTGLNPEERQSIRAAAATKKKTRPAEDPVVAGAS